MLPNPTSFANPEIQFSEIVRQAKANRKILDPSRPQTSNQQLSKNSINQKLTSIPYDSFRQNNKPAKRAALYSPQHYQSPQNSSSNFIGDPFGNSLRLESRPQSLYSKYSFKEGYKQAIRRDCSLTKPLCTAATCLALFNSYQQTAQLKRNFDLESAGLKRNLSHNYSLFNQIKNYTYQNVKKLEKEQKSYYTIQTMNHLIYIHNLVIDGLVGLQSSHQVSSSYFFRNPAQERLQMPTQIIQSLPIDSRKKVQFVQKQQSQVLHSLPNYQAIPVLNLQKAPIPNNQFIPSPPTNRASSFHVQNHQIINNSESHLVLYGRVRPPISQQNRFVGRPQSPKVIQGTTHIQKIQFMHGGPLSPRQHPNQQQVMHHHHQHHQVVHLHQNIHQAPVQVQVQGPTPVQIQVPTPTPIQVQFQIPNPVQAPVPPPVQVQGPSQVQISEYPSQSRVHYSRPQSNVQTINHIISQSGIYSKLEPIPQTFDKNFQVREIQNLKQTIILIEKERNTYIHTLQKIQQETVILREKLIVIEQEKTDWGTQVQKLKERIEWYVDERMKQREDIQKWKKQVSKLQLDNYEGTLKQAETQVSRSKKQIQTYLEEISHLKAQITQLKSKLSSNKAEGSPQKEILKLTETVTEYERQLEESQRHIAYLQGQYNSLGEKYMQYEQQYNKLAEEYNRSVEEVYRLQEINKKPAENHHKSDEDLIEQEKETNSKIKWYQTIIHTLTSKEETFIEKITVLEKSIQSYTDQITSLKQSLSVSTNKISTLQQLLSESNEKIHNLGQIPSSTDSEAQSKQISSLKTQISNLHAVLSNKDEQIKEITFHLSHAEQHIILQEQKMNENYQNLSLIIAQMQAEIDRLKGLLHHQIQNLDPQTQIFQQTVFLLSSLNQQTSHYFQEIKISKQRLTQQLKMIEVYTKEINQLRQATFILRTQISNMQASIKEKSQDGSQQGALSQQEQFIIYQQQINQYEITINTHLQQISHYQSIINSYYQQIDHFQLTINEIRITIEKYANDVREVPHHAQVRIALLSQENKRLHELINSNQGNGGSSTVEINKLKQIIAQHERTINNVKEEIRLLQLSGTSQTQIKIKLLVQQNKRLNQLIALSKEEIKKRSSGTQSPSKDVQELERKLAHYSLEIQRLYQVTQNINEYEGRIKILVQENRRLTQMTQYVTEMQLRIKFLGQQLASNKPQQINEYQVRIKVLTEQIQRLTQTITDYQNHINILQEQNRKITLHLKDFESHYNIKVAEYQNHIAIVTDSFTQQINRLQAEIRYLHELIASLKHQSQAYRYQIHKQDQKLSQSSVTTTTATLQGTSGSSGIVFQQGYHAQSSLRPVSHQKYISPSTFFGQNQNLTGKNALLEQK